MDSKRIAAAATGLLLLWGGVQVSAQSVQGSPAQRAPAITDGVPENAGATGGEVIVLEIGPMQGQPSEEEVAAMQMLLLQLLMMQQQEPSGEGVIIPSNAPIGVSI
jgi:hypothetical protein